jgi:hypothetical protein
MLVAVVRAAAAESASKPTPTHACALMNPRRAAQLRAHPPAHFLIEPLAS